MGCCEFESRWWQRPFYRAGDYIPPVNLLIDHKLRPVVNRQVGSHPTVMLDIGMPYPPWNRIQLVVH